MVSPLPAFSPLSKKQVRQLLSCDYSILKYKQVYAINKQLISGLQEVPYEKGVRSSEFRKISRKKNCVGVSFLIFNKIAGLRPEVFKSTFFIGHLQRLLLQLITTINSLLLLMHVFYYRK